MGDAFRDQQCASAVLGGLSFPEELPSKTSTDESSSEVPCVFCNRRFVNTEAKNDALLHHLLLEHQLVIADVSQVCDMKRWINLYFLPPPPQPPPPTPRGTPI